MLAQVVGLTGGVAIGAYMPSLLVSRQIRGISFPPSSMMPSTETWRELRRIYPTDCMKKPQGEPIASA